MFCDITHYYLLITHLLLIVFDILLYYLLSLFSYVLLCKILCYIITWCISSFIILH